jgi:hypothetical protein
LVRLQASINSICIKDIVASLPNQENIEQLEVRKARIDDLPQVVRDKLGKANACTDQGCVHDSLFIVNAIYKPGEDGVKQQEVNLVFSPDPTVAEAQADAMVAMVEEHGLEILAVLPGLGVLGRMPKHAKNVADSIKVIFKGKDAVDKAEKILKRNEAIASFKIEADKQGKHIRGHKHYIEGRSELTHNNPQFLVNKFSGKGQPANDILRGMPGFKERFDAGETIGYYMDTTKNKIPTTKGIIVYSNKGVHIYPSKP